MNQCVVCERPSASLYDTIHPTFRKFRSPSHCKVIECEEQFRNFCKILKIHKRKVDKFLSQCDWGKLYLTPFCEKCTEISKDLIQFDKQRVEMEAEVINLQTTLCEKLRSLSHAVQNLDKLYDDLKELSSEKHLNDNKESVENAIQELLNSIGSKKYSRARKKPKSVKSIKAIPRLVLSEEEISNLKETMTNAVREAKRAEPRPSTLDSSRERKMIKKYPKKFVVVAPPSKGKLEYADDAETEGEINKHKLKRDTETDAFVGFACEVEIKEEPSYLLSETEECDFEEANEMNLQNIDDSQADEEDYQTNFLPDHSPMSDGGSSSSDRDEIVPSRKMLDKRTASKKSLSLIAWDSDDDETPLTSLVQSKIKSRIKSTKAKQKQPVNKKPPANSKAKNNLLIMKREESDDDEKMESETDSRPRRSCTRKKINKVKYDSDLDFSSSSDEEKNPSDWSEDEKFESEEAEKRQFAIYSEQASKILERYKWLDDYELKDDGKIMFRGIELIPKEKMSFQCGQCDLHLKNIKRNRCTLDIATLRLRKHIQEAHLGGFSCARCLGNHKFPHYRNLEDHIKRHEQTIEHCEICARPFKSDSWAKNKEFHMWSHKSDQEKAEAIAAGQAEPLPPQTSYKKDRDKNFLCRKCGKGFGLASSLATHEESHLDPSQRERLPCPECGNLYIRHSLQLHIKYAHQRDTLTRHPCKFCDKSYLTKSILNAHVKAVHSTERPFSCPHCSQTFISQFRLKHHSQTHLAPEKRKKFKCENCDYECFWKRNLKRHVETVHDPNSSKTYIPRKGNTRGRPSQLRTRGAKKSKREEEESSSESDSADSSDIEYDEGEEEKPKGTQVQGNSLAQNNNPAFMPCTINPAALYADLIQPAQQQFQQYFNATQNNSTYYHNYKY